MSQRQHETKWTVYYIRTRAVRRFDDEEDARGHAMTYCDGITPVSIVRPLYCEE